MAPESQPLRTRLQLFLLHGLRLVLSTFDSLFHVRWGERLLARSARRWQGQLADLDAQLALLEQERVHLASQVRALAIHAAAIYLAGRNLAHGELCFDPAAARDDEILDATIDLLVKERLAAIEPEEIDTGQYVYHLEPDWAAIRARLVTAADQAEPETAEWLREGLAFIDETYYPFSGESRWNDL